MNLKINRIVREFPDPSFDGRNGFSTMIELVFEIVETETCFEQEVSRVIATTTKENLAKLIVSALIDFDKFHQIEKKNILSAV